MSFWLFHRSAWRDLFLAFFISILAGILQNNLSGVIGSLYFFAFYPSLFFLALIVVVWAGALGTLLSLGIITYFFIEPLPKRAPNSRSNSR